MSDRGLHADRVRKSATDSFARVRLGTGGIFSGLSIRITAVIQSIRKDGYPGLNIQTSANNMY